MAATLTAQTNPEAETMVRELAAADYQARGGDGPVRILWGTGYPNYDDNTYVCTIRYGEYWLVQDMPYPDHFRTIGYVQVTR